MQLCLRNTAAYATIIQLIQLTWSRWAEYCNVQYCTRQIAVQRLRMWRTDERTDIQCRLNNGIRHCTVASRRTVYTRGVVARPSDIVLSATCLYSVVFSVATLRTVLAAAPKMDCCRIAVAADAALLYSWPYGLPAATSQASYGTSTQHVCCCTAERLLQTTTAVLPEIAGSHELLLTDLPTAVYVHTRQCIAAWSVITASL